MKELVEYIAKALVNNPDEVVVTETEEADGTILLELNVNSEDMGKVIGRQGRIAKSMRTVVKTAAARQGKKVILDIVD